MLVLYVSVHSYVSLEPLLASRTLEGQRLTLLFLGLLGNRGLGVEGLVFTFNILSVPLCSTLTRFIPFVQVWY